MRYSILYPDGGAFPPVVDDIIVRNANYKLVAEGVLPDGDAEDALEGLFELFNVGDRPVPIRSMSMGDVVRLQDRGDWICLFVGWSPVVVSPTFLGWHVEIAAGAPA